MTNTNGGTAAPRVPDLGPATLVYIEKVRQATRRLKSREPTLGGSGPDTVRVSLDALREVATFDVEVPTASQRREWEFVKIAIKRLTSWYFRFLAAQLNVFGAHVINLGDTLAARTDGLESAADELAVRVGAAEERLRRLEALGEARNSRPKPPAQENWRAHQEPKGKNDVEGASTPTAAPKRGGSKDSNEDRPKRVDE
ncbi:MAG TPA: hypothetical protein VMF65_24125 [Acidimicrobiales bacterium]|nr:hypothetical protein [Acidimicrobiales bacterium]